jgi:hypothetical protein
MKMITKMVNISRQNTHTQTHTHSSMEQSPFWEDNSSQLVRIHPALYGTRWFITACPRPKSDQFSPCLPIPRLEDPFSYYPAMFTCAWTWCLALWSPSKRYSHAQVFCTAGVWHGRRKVLLFRRHSQRFGKVLVVSCISDRGAWFRWPIPSTEWRAHCIKLALRHEQYME